MFLTTVRDGMELPSARHMASFITETRNVISLKAWRASAADSFKQISRKS